MSKPAKPKALKPKTGADEAPASMAESIGKELPKAAPKSNGAKKGSSEGDALTMMQLIILAAVMLVCSIVGPAAALYFIGPQVIKPLMASHAPAGEEGGEAGGHGEAPAGEEGDPHGGGKHGETAAEQVGIGLKFDEFTVNLKRDPTLRGNQYLRAKMSVSLAVPKEKDCMTPLVTGGHDAHAAPAGGGGGHGAPAAPSGPPAELCQKTIQDGMMPFAPTLRDIVNTAFMKRSASQIASIEGQEALKDEIRTEMDSVLGNSGYHVLRVNFEDFVVQR